MAAKYKKFPMPEWEQQQHVKLSYKEKENDIHIQKTTNHYKRKMHKSMQRRLFFHSINQSNFQSSKARDGKSKYNNISKLGLKI